jgi:hypothetical protein
MTLTLALGNPEFVIQLSDRQLSEDGAAIELTENKATLLTCRNARYLVGFTGLARADSLGFRTAEWLLEALAEAAPPDYLAEGLVKRFVRVASERFGQDDLQSIAPKHRRLTIMFTGYGYWADPPLWIGALVTNYQDFSSGRDDAEPWDEFRQLFIWETRPTVDGSYPTYIQRVGAWRALPVRIGEGLRPLLEPGFPPAAVIGKAVEVMRSAADDPRAGGTIGKDLMSGLGANARKSTSRTGQGPARSNPSSEGADAAQALRRPCRAASLVLFSADV